MYYVIWPYDHRKVTILSTHATIKHAYAELDLLGDVVESSPDGSTLTSLTRTTCPRTTC